MTKPGMKPSHEQPPRLERDNRLTRQTSVGLEQDTMRQRSQVWKHTQVLAEGNIWFEDDPRSNKNITAFKTYHGRSSSDHMTMGGVSSGWATISGSGGVT